MNVSVIINFATAAITFIFGVLLLSGNLFPGGVDSSKLMFGVVLIIYGVYRFINSFTRIKQAKMEEERNKINEKRESLFDKP
ncbi:MAG: hypothetical protein M3P82_00505 [Bacteroidota bacterium]|nr:hypothetical protein [Bacteroidota bacterium]